MTDNTFSLSPEFETGNGAVVLNMYVQYFGLKEHPFTLSPDPRYLYLSQRHQDALAHLLYGITVGGGFVQLSGEVGTGKTMMLRALLQRLPETVDVALVLYPFLTVREFMLALCDDLHIQRPAEPSLKALIDTLNDFLLENHAKGRRTVLIVDEAHRLNREVLEQIRLLTNLETTKEKLLQIVLAGQPELNSLLAQPDMRQLAQRITARYDLQALSSRETREYVLHRCRIAGAKTVLFTPLALRQIYYYTGGVPRLVNILCDRALLAAYARGRTRVGAWRVRAAALELEPAHRPANHSMRWLGGLVLLAGLVVAGAWQFVPDWSARLGLNATEIISAAVQQENHAPPAAPATDSALSPDDASNLPNTPPLQLTQLLADTSVPTDTDTAFGLLFSRWSLQYAEFPGQTGCERAAQAGLRCLFAAGTWNNLRQLNRPAIVELVDESGARHHILATRLDGERVTLSFPDRSYEYPLAEIDRVWFGKYLILWNAPAFSDKTVRRGMRGPSVAWVRDVLAQYGLPRSTAPASDVFDAELDNRVREFQRRHQLQDDGIVGTMTLVYLSTYASHAQSPTLTGAVHAIANNR